MLLLLDTSSLAWIDLLGLLLVCALLVLGYIRGLWWQVIRLVGVASALLLARSLTPALERQLASHFQELDPRLAHGLAWLGLLVLGLGLAALLGHLGRAALEALQLDLLDRLGGLLAGAITGLLLHAALLALLVQLAPGDLLQKYLADTRSEILLDTLTRQWPVLVNSDSAQRLHGWLEPEHPASVGAEPAAH